MSSDNNNLIPLFGIAAAIFAISKIVKPATNEGFLGNLPSMQTKVWSSIGNEKGDIYSIPGQYQSMLSPRMSGGVDYGANIRYNLPAYRNLAVPCDPLSMGDMVSKNYTKDTKNIQNTKEPYCGSGSCGSPVSCKVGGGSINIASPSFPNTNYTPGNFNEVLAKAQDNSNYPEAVSMLPVGNMTTVNSIGEVVQPIVYDRFVYANRNSRLRGQGDQIRGDLPIVPCAGGWFRPSVNPNIDLQQGALNILAGNNEAGNALAQLIMTSSGGTDTTIAGVNMSNQFNTCASAGFSDISVTAFP